MKTTVLTVLAVMAISGGAQRAETFTGLITDSECAERGHAAMRMGPTDAECARVCVLAHDAQYVLLDGERVYLLSDQQTPETFAGQTVTVVGTLDTTGKTIRVESIAASQ